MGGFLRVSIYGVLEEEAEPKRNRTWARLLTSLATGPPPCRLSNEVHLGHGTVRIILSVCPSHSRPFFSNLPDPPPPPDPPTTTTTPSPPAPPPPPPPVSLGAEEGGRGGNRKWRKKQNFLSAVCYCRSVSSINSDDLA